MELIYLEPWNFPLERYNKEFMKRKIAIMTVSQGVKNIGVIISKAKERLRTREGEATRTRRREAID